MAHATPVSHAPEPAQFHSLTGTDWGQGKTDVALGVAEGLTERGYTVGGFCVRRVYSPAAVGFEVTGLEVLLLRSGESVLVARTGYQADEPLGHRADRRDGMRIGLEGEFHVSRAAVKQVAQAAQCDQQDPEVDAFILDEIGPLLFKTRQARNKRSAPFFQLALDLVDQPKPFTLMVFSDPDMQSAESIGIRKHIEAHPSRIRDRIQKRIVHASNFRVLAAEILADVPARRR